MEKFKIVEKFKLFNQTEAHILNMPFALKREEDEYQDRLRRLSSYHDALFNEPEWPIYGYLPPCTINIAISIEDYTGLEAVSLMKNSGGFPLTRDNLFMLPFFFKEKVRPFKAIYAFMDEEYLPTHENGKKIVPWIKIEEHRNQDLDYDWYFFHNTFRAGEHFAFFSFNYPELKKPHK